MITSNRPAELGYRWPAEWEPHAATWLAWPHNRDTWPGSFEPIPLIFQQLVHTLARFEPVQVLAGSAPVLQDAYDHVGSLNGVTIHDVPTNDAWTRDYGPIFLSPPQKQRAALVDWQYNAWGGKYPPFDRDNAVPRRIARLLNHRRFAPPLVLEGGSIEGNGQGTILTTRSCLLHPGRNSGKTQAEIESYLQQYLAAKKIIWLPGGDFSGDDTDGHIDQLARFVGPRTVVVATAPRTDVNHTMLQANRVHLQQQTNQDDQPLELIDLPLPQPVFHQEHRLPASYCNFYILNGAVVVPQFDDPADADAVDILRHCFPDRQVCGLPARELLWGLGAVHCLTQQQCA